MNPRTLSLVRASAVVALATAAVFASGQGATAPADKFWLTLKAPRKLAPSESFVADIHNRPKFKREVISFRYRLGDQVVAYLITPKNVKKPAVSMVLYSYPAAATDRFLNESYCERLAEYGIAFLGFESALTGERYRGRPMKEWFVSELPESLGTTAQDIQFFADYIQSRSDLDGSRIGFFGEGSGGTAAILASTVDARIRVLDLQNPWGNWPEWMKKAGELKEKERPAYLKPEFLKKVVPYDAQKVFKRVKASKVRINLVPGDKNAPDAVINAFANAAPTQANVLKYKDVQAYYRAVSGGRLFQWMANNLKALK